MNLLIKIAPIRFGVLLPAALMLFIFAGCAVVGPDYVKPDTPMPEAWHTPVKNNLAGEHIDKEALADWWTILDDPVLTNLVESAVAGNLGLKEARARVREARARRGITEAGRFPTIDASGSARSSRSSEETGSGSGRSGPAGRSRCEPARLPARRPAPACRHSDRALRAASEYAPAMRS